MNIEINKESATRTVATVNGWLSSAEAEEFSEKLLPLAGEPGELALDLAGLEYISSAGIRCFLQLLKASKAAGSKLILVNMLPQVKDIFSLTALLDKFDLE